jgi:mannose-6-phosphate isomerase-like protein (cupin superfamily)
MPPQFDLKEDLVVTRFLGVDSRPSWSDVTSAGIFAVAPDGKFDRHFHDCDEYWLFFEGRGVVTVGETRYAVEAGDIVCTPIGVEHDVVAVVETLKAFWFEGATAPGGRLGHLHRDDDAAAGHPIQRITDVEAFLRG